MKGDFLSVSADQSWNKPTSLDLCWKNSFYTNLLLKRPPPPPPSLQETEQVIELFSLIKVIRTIPILIDN